MMMNINNNNNVYLLLLLFLITILLMIQTTKIIEHQSGVGVVLVGVFVDALIITGSNNDNPNNSFRRRSSSHHRLLLRPDYYDSTTRTRTTTSLLNNAVTSNIASVITTSTTTTTNNDNDDDVVGSRTKSTPTTAPTNTQYTTSSSNDTAAAVTTIVVLPESIWRTAAFHQRTQIQKKLQAGLVNNDHPLMAAIVSQRKRQQQEKSRQRKQQQQKQQQQQQQQKLDDHKDENDEIKKENKDENDHDQEDESMTVLDPKHPVYNFLVEYYGLKGLKGPKRLARWSPSISLLLFNVRTLEYLEYIDDDNEDSIDEDNTDTTNDDDTTTNIKTITSLEELNDASSSGSFSNNDNDFDIDCIGRENDGIFLEGATPDDFALILHLKGAEWIDGNNCEDIFGPNTSNDNKSGVLYRPFRCYNDVVVVVDDDNDDETDNIHDVIAGTLETVISSSSSSNNNHNHNTNTNHNKIASYIWYKSILETTIQSEPILHCYGLHEWAMQYHPVGAEKPPSVRCFYCVLLCFVLFTYTFTVHLLYFRSVSILFAFCFVSSSVFILRTSSHLRTHFHLYYLFVVLFI
jgi:hypothetical protein